MADGPRRAFTVCREPHLNSLSNVWYCTCTLALSIYIVAGTVQKFTKYMSLPWPPRDQPYIELNVYVGCIGAAVIMMPFFVASAMLQVGNMANDGATIGGEIDDAAPAPDPSALYENLPRRSRFRRRGACMAAVKRWLKAAWRHGGPTAPFIHMLSAFCLLLPRIIMHARLIRHGFIKRSDVWHTDLDFLVPHRERLVILHFLPTVNESELWDRDAVESSLPRTHLDVTGHISAEFINYAFALLVYSLRYPGVFWKRNKCFALLFSAYLVVTMVSLKLLLFCSIGIIHAVHVVGVRELVPRFGALFLRIPGTLCMAALYAITLTASGSVLYSYGLLKYQDWKSRMALKHHITWKGVQAGGITFWGHGPHIYGFLILVALAVSGAPLVHDMIRVFQGSLDGILLVTFVSMLLHICLWIFIWLIFTLKQEWNFCAEGGPLSDSPSDYHGYIASTYMPLIKASNGIDTPLIVIDNGQTHQVREISSKKAILSLATQYSQVSKLPHPSEDEEIYWLKPRIPGQSDKTSSTGNGNQVNHSLSWLRSQKPKAYQPSNPVKHKVSFNEKPQIASPNRNGAKSPAKLHRVNKKTANLPPGVDDPLLDAASDAICAGDYATLRALSPQQRPDVGGEFYKSLCPLGDDAAAGDYEMLMVDTTGGNVCSQPIRAHVHPGALSPTATLTPRSDCVSDTSTSPEKGNGSNSGDSSSSGVHSACSEQMKRHSSLEQLIIDCTTPQIQNGSVRIAQPWKSMSLQRNQLPPTSHYGLCDGTNSLVIRRTATATDGSGMTASIGRKPSVRLTSFTDQPDFPQGPCKVSPPIVPPPPPMIPPHISLMQSSLKPIGQIIPQRHESLNSSEISYCHSNGIHYVSQHT